MSANKMPSPSELPVHDKTSYLHMLWASLAFAVMAAFSHRAGESCDWQLVVVARAVVAFFFAAIIAIAGRVKLVWRGSATLWVRSVAGSTAGRESGGEGRGAGGGITCWWRI